MTADPTAVVVTPGGDPEIIEVRVHNLSPIVDAYVVEIVDPPSWLTTTTAEVRLLPTTNDLARVTLAIGPGALVPAGAVELVIRVRSQAHPEIWLTEPVEVTVPAIEAPIGLRLEPSMVRAKDAEPGRLQATVDNKGSNQRRRVTLSARDLEGVVRFTFSPSVLDLEPGQSAAAQLQVQAPKPEAGQQVTRQLTVVASDGNSEVEATATFVQVAAADTPLALRLEPTLLRVRDGDSGTLEAVLDNRRGTRTRRVFLSGRDPEGLVTFTFSPPSLDVFAGESVMARVRLAAPPPEAGAEATRTVTVLATSDGSADVEATATFVQATSAIAPLLVQLDPAVVRVRDSVSGTFEAIIDNRGGRRVRRVSLTGRDPERLVRFTFTPPSLDVLPDTIGRARIVVQAPPPDPGQDATRQLTISASDGGAPVEITGTFVQTTSVSAPVVVKLEPSLVRVRDSPVGQFQVIADNRHGIRGRRVSLAGSDPERAVGFSFWPPVLEIGPGEIGRATARIEAYPPEPGAPKPPGSSSSPRPTVSGTSTPAGRSCRRRPRRHRTSRWCCGSTRAWSGCAIGEPARSPPLPTTGAAGARVACTSPGTTRSASSDSRSSRPSLISRRGRWAVLRHASRRRGRKAGRNPPGRSRSLPPTESGTRR